MSSDNPPICEDCQQPMTALGHDGENDYYVCPQLLPVIAATIRDTDPTGATFELAALSEALKAAECLEKAQSMTAAMRQGTLLNTRRNQRRVLRVLRLLRQADEAIATGKLAGLAMGIATGELAPPAAGGDEAQSIMLTGGLLALLEGQHRN